MTERQLWHPMRYIRPSRRRTAHTRALMESLVYVHKRQAAWHLRHCPGCGAFMAKNSRAERCRPCTRRADWGETQHWWTGLRGREKRTKKPSG